MAGDTDVQSRYSAKYYGNKMARYIVCILCCLSCGILILMSGIPFKPRTRIKVVWITVIILAIVTGFSIGFVTFGKIDIETSSSDITTVTSKSYPFFCSWFNLKDSDYPVDVFKFNKNPVVSNNLTIYNYTKSFYVDYGKHRYWKYYLLKGSSVTLYVNDSNVDIYIVKGREKFEFWKIFYSFYELHSDARGEKDTPIKYTIHKSDEYYLIADNHEYSPGLNLQVQIEINRTSYDFSAAELFCEHSHNCSVHFSKTITEESVIVVSPDVKTDSIVLATSCSRRKEIFIILFCILPICIAIIWSVLIYCLCIRNKKIISDRELHRLL